ncbi:MAG TPA: hypothetical protein VFD57_08640 [Clostridia bacterium]|nr:hypothetical protein [Clostridia bacterium]
MKNGYPPVNIKFQDRRRYYDCFTDYYKKGEEPSMLISMIKEYVKEELERYVKILDDANNAKGFDNEGIL